MSNPSAPTPSPQITGRWQMKSGNFGGEPIPQLVCQNTILQFDGDRYAFLLDAGTTDSGVIIWQPEPGAALLRSEGGPNHGRCLPSEFTTRGNLLRISCSISNPSDPTHPQQSYTALFTRLP